MLRLCRYNLSRVKIVSSQENHSQHASPLSQLSNLLCRHLSRPMDHAGAMEKYNSVEGLLAPAREGALRPLSGRYLLKLAAGQRSLMWSSLVFGIDTISIFDTSSFSWVQVSCPPTRQEEGNSSGGRICRKMPSTFRQTRQLKKVSTPTSRSFSSLPCRTGGFPRVHGGVIESCISTVEQPVFSSA